MARIRAGLISDDVTGSDFGSSDGLPCLVLGRLAVIRSLVP